MKLLGRLLGYLTYLNLIIATSAYALAAGVANMSGIDNYLEHGLFGFFSTFCVYNCQRLYKVNKNSTSPRLKWVFTHRKLVFVSSLISGGLSLYYFVLLMNGLNYALILLMCCGALISAFYVLRIGNKNLRDRSYIKTHSIAITWTLVILIFPMVNEGIYHWDFLLFFIPAHYLYFISVAVVFDINDLKVDPSTQQTIPQIVGSRHTKKVSLILLSVSTIGITYCVSNPFTIGAILIQMLLIGLITDKHSDNYFNILIDGTISLLGFSYLAL